MLIANNCTHVHLKQFIIKISEQSYKIFQFPGQTIPDEVPKLGFLHSAGKREGKSVNKPLNQSVS